MVKLRSVSDKDNDNDHSFSQLPVHKAPSCPKGQSAWAVGQRKLALCKNVIKHGVPFRPLAAYNAVVLHLCWKGDVVHPR